MNTSSPTSRLTRAATAAAAVALAAGLTACGVQFQPDGTSDGPASESSTQKPKSAERPTTTESENSASEDATGASASRGALADSVERIVSCPAGALEIADIGSVLQLDADCPELLVSGSGTVVLAENVGALTVTGVGLTVLVKELGSANVSGTGNTVTWESGTPTVNNSGTANTLLPAS